MKKARIIELNGRAAATGGMLLADSPTAYVSEAVGRAFPSASDMEEESMATEGFHSLSLPSTTAEAYVGCGGLAAIPINECCKATPHITTVHIKRLARVFLNNLLSLPAVPR